MRRLPRVAAVAGLAVAFVVAPSASAAERSLVDRPDDLAGREQVHTMYVLPADGADRQLDVDGTLADSMATWHRWLGEQAGGRRLRLDTAGGELDVSFVRLGRTDAELEATGPYVRNLIEDELRARGLIAPNKIYAAYYDGRSNYSCGGGAFPPALPGQVGALYLNGLPEARVTCASQAFSTPAEGPRYLEFAMLHELLHTLGFVAQCAPHAWRFGHVSDSSTDLMYGGDEPWRPGVLDIGRDDYFATGRTGCADLALSPFLDGTPPPQPDPAPEPNPVPRPDPTPGPGPAPLPERLPPPGNTVIPRATVGPSPTPALPLRPRCRVPKLRGLTIRRARVRLRRAGCRLAPVSARRAKRGLGARRVTSQRPRPGARGPKGMRVRITVSR